MTLTTLCPPANNAKRGSHLDQDPQKLLLSYRSSRQTMVRPRTTSKPFQDFLQQWSIEHVNSSPRYPQSNGKAEAIVKSMKKIIKASWNGRAIDDDKLTQALLQYHNTPSRRDRVSPAQKLFGHPIQDNLPAHRRAFLPEWQRF